MKKRTTTTMESPDRLNVIVEGSKVLGDMVTESNLRIDGEVIGNVNVASKIVIGKTGRIKGNLTCGSADIEGQVNGILKVDDILILRESARIEGEITTQKFQVDEGAIFTGNCRMSGTKSTTTTAPNPAKPAAENVVY